MREKTIIYLFLLFLGFVVVEGWGPLSHYYFARQAFSANPGIVDGSLKQGVDLPGILFTSLSFSLLYLFFYLFLLSLFISFLSFLSFSH